MSKYLYAGIHGDRDPFSFSITTSYFVLRLISQWDVPELYRGPEKHPPHSADEWYSESKRREEGEYSIKAFKQAQDDLPKSLDELIPFIKQHWEPRDVLKMGMDIGSGEVTRELYADALAVIDKAVAAGNDVYAF